MPAFPYTRKTFENGLRLLRVLIPQSVSTTVLVLAGVGSKDEPRELSGISHFLEHLGFKGTARRATSREISTALDALGAESNAFTGFEYTGYYAKAANGAFPAALDILSDVYLNAALDPAEVDRERGVILEEINMYEDLPMRKIRDVFRDLLYGDTPAGRPILGTRETVSRLSRDEITRYRDEHYEATRTVVVVAGGYEGDVESLVGGAFRNAARRAASLDLLDAGDGVIAEPLVRFETKKTDQDHLVLGFPAFPLSDPRRPTLALLQSVLGGSMSSRLFLRIRDEMGAAYYVNSFSDLDSRHGYIGIAAGIDRSRRREVVRALLEETRRLADDVVPIAELEKSREHLVGNLLLDLETSDEVAGFYGIEELLLGKPRTPDEAIALIRAVTQEDVRALARDLFGSAKPRLALIGADGANEELLSLL
ncbi:MAG: insulinase family protein [Candidatus Colwellbacteria bacterium]|nr:insulinase family protein [Candidatus Colwellbacteria bacterium]